jgi:energy-coupling factor transporter ATP-binding protein EcfA2
MHVSDSSAPLTLAQQAAVARICYALEQPGAVVLLCGPGGAGKSTVLAHVEGCRQLQSRTVCRRGLDDVQELLDGRGGREPSLDTLLVDDAHLAGDGELSRLVSRCRSSRGPVGVVLAGEGRLFTLIARDARLEQLVRLRATLPPFSLDESRLLLASALTAAGPSENRDAVARCIHEIAGGIPAVVRRLADTVSVFAEAHPARVIVPDDIETMHRRLSVNAA